MNKLMMQEDTVVRPTHGLVAFANAASFQNTHFSEAMTTYARGWRDPSNLKAMLDFLFPPVQVPRRFEFRQADEHADFLYETDDSRGVGADFKRVAYKGSIQNSKTVNKGLTVFVDLDEVQGQTNWEQEYTARLLKRCVRNDLYTAIAALIAGTSLTNSNWAANGADPDQVLLDLCEASGDLMGFNPNRLGFFGNAWVKRLAAVRKLTTEGGKASAMLTTPTQVAQFCGMEMGMDINARVSSGTAKSKVGGGNYVIAFSAEDGSSPDDPSHTKRFWTPCADGTEYRVYVRQVTEKLMAITIERYNRFVVTSTVGLKGHTITQA